ncbi:MAG TPA: MFS transporter [Bryobacteraceae bacterium]|jgi:hypothetical protein|nr:MFS transporter [Bryobacteraceae bacterium]
MPPRYRDLLRRNRNFRLLWMAQVVSENGDWFYTIAIYSLLLEVTGSAKSIGFAFILQVLPQFFIAPAAGILNDRISRRKLMMFADWTRAVIVLCMLAARSPGAIWLLYLLLFFETLMVGLFEPARNSVIPNVVGEREVVGANTLAAITWSFDFAAGAALGGLAAAFLGRDAIFVLDSLSFVVSALLIRRMRFIEPHVENLAPVRARDLLNLAPLSEGLRYVRGNPRLAATLFAKCGLGILGANWVIIPVFGERIFPVRLPRLDGQKAAMLGMSALMTSRGVGAILGPLAGARWAGESMVRLRTAIGLGFAAAGLGYIGLGFSSALGWAALALILAHGGLSMVWVFSTTMLQLQAGDRFRGRVFSAEFGISVLTMSLSTYLAGKLVDQGVPLRTVAILGGCAMLVPLLLWIWAQRFWRGSQGQKAYNQ